MDFKTAFFIDSKGSALKVAGRFSFGRLLMRLENIFDLIFNPTQRYDLTVSFITPDKGKLVVRRGRKTTGPRRDGCGFSGGTAGLPTKG